MQRIGEKLKAIPGGYWRFSSIEFLYRFTWAANSFMTVFLQSQGMSASQVGLINAMCSTMSIIASPVWGVVSDKLRSVRKVFLLVITLGALTWALIPSAFNLSVFGLSSVTMGLIMIAIASFFNQPTNSLVDSWVVQNANRQRLNYGAIRMWGAIGYAIMNIILGALVPHIGVNTTFYVLAVWTVPLFLLCRSTKNDAQNAKKLSVKEMQISRLFKNYYFVTYLIYSVILHMAVNASYTFLPYLMEEMQVPIGLFGGVTGLRAMLQVPVLLMIANLRKRYSLPKIMLLSSCMYMAEFFCYSMLSGTVSLFLLQALNGLAGGLMLGCASNYIYLLAPSELKATAQTVNGSFNSLSSIAGSLLSGWLMDLMGVRSYYLLAACMILFSVLFFFSSFLLGRRVSREPSPMRVISG